MKLLPQLGRGLLHQHLPEQVMPKRQPPPPVHDHPCGHRLTHNLLQLPRRPPNHNRPLPHPELHPQQRRHPQRVKSLRRQKTQPTTQRLNQRGRRGPRHTRQLGHPIHDPHQTSSHQRLHQLPHVQRIPTRPHQLRRQQHTRNSTQHLSGHPDHISRAQRLQINNRAAPLLNRHPQPLQHRPAPGPDGAYPTTTTESDPPNAPTYSTTPGSAHQPNADPPPPTTPGRSAHNRSTTPNIRSPAANTGSDVPDPPSSPPNRRAIPTLAGSAESVEIPKRSAINRNGKTCPCPSAATLITTQPADKARPATAPTNADFPIPGSPSTHPTPPRPATTSTNNPVKTS